MTLQSIGVGHPSLKRSAVDPVERRKQIIKAAVDVFAERGFHRSRVSDIARRAGVAHGLIYHYFASKEDLLHSIFDDNWSLFVKVLEDLRDQRDVPAPERLDRVNQLLLDALGVVPSTIQVMIQEVSRSDRFVHPNNLAAFRRAFHAVEAIVIQGQEDETLKSDLEPTVVAHIIMGALETVCTGFLLGHLRNTEANLTRAKATVAQTLLRGLRNTDG
ncbi:MAG: TetR/AcrR family transcriptional regulator [Myxococcota bacterium]